MSDEIKTDFCVVGGGPAGLALALMLLRSGVRVVLAERSMSLDREYRGEILQPGGMMILDGLGALEGAKARGAIEHDRFKLVEGRRTQLDIDYRKLPAPYDHLLSIPQRHLLAELLERCREYEGFTLLAGGKATDLLEEDGAVRGVRAKGPDGEYTVHAHCVIGADGRYSKVRRLAGIENIRNDVFDFDVLWFKLPAPPLQGAPDVQIFRYEGSPVIVYRSWPDSLQLGWTLPHKGYREIAAQGIEHVRAEIARAVPPFADLIRSGVTSLHDLTLLDVFAGTAERWVRDGLVLIGDAAHTHSPLGAQGINLALQDAALLHPVLLDSLREGRADAALLGRYEEARRPTIDAVMRMQVMQAKGMLARDGGPASVLRPLIGKVITKTPIGMKITRRIAHGPTPVRVRNELFVA
ncbi:FAD-dependent monooxygenase [Streptomyces sp. NPDC052396]|uniref:FAD-dependent monooxygenase n=1 Tax=Streptomyces sp. NPDC052396 TaxID=3365689 RepID=UPI0037D98EA9